jgi:hypothetical protein
MVVIRYCLLLLLFQNISFAQEKESPIIIDSDPITRQAISESDLEPYKGDEDFNYSIEDIEKNALDKLVIWLKNGLSSILESLFGVEGAVGIVLFIFRVLPYLLLGFLVYLLLRFFLKVNSSALIGKTQDQGEVYISEDEQIIKNEDISALISKAIANRNYRLAIRYYYLQALKYLTLGEHISWAPQKTNDDYLNELQQTSIRLEFEKITRIYDYIWYGEFQINSEAFNQIKMEFEILNSKIAIQ